MFSFNALAESGVNLAAFGSQELVDYLNKALAPGYETDPTAMVDGQAMRVQSLDRTLKVVTFAQKELKLWPAINGQRVGSTVHEYNRLTRWGNRRSGSFIADGQLPQSRELSMERAVAFVKFMGQVREVTHGMTLVQTAHGDPLTFEKKAGTTDLLFDVERSLFNGKSSVYPLAFDGIIEQAINTNGLTSDYVIDLRGDPLDEEKIEDAGALIRKGAGTPTDLFFSIDAHKDLSKHFWDRGRISFPQGGGQQGKLVAGAPIQGFNSNSGMINFNSNAFFTPGTDVAENTPLTAKSHTNAPGTPTLGSTPIAVASDSASEYGASDAGNYVFYLATVNHAGESAGVRCPATGVQAIASGEKVTFQLTYTSDGVYNATSNPNGVTGVKVYRGAKNVAAPAVADCKLVAEIGLPTGANGTNDEYVEYNHYLPDTSLAFMADMGNGQAIEWRQLCPLLKMDLALIAPVRRFMLLLYGMPILFAPKRVVVFRNIGPYAAS